MRNVVVLGTGLMLVLGCGGVADLRRDANDALREEARSKFVDVCVRVGPNGSPLSREACTCVADEVLRTHTTAELLRFAADPNAQELVPIVKTCARKLAR